MRFSAGIWLRALKEGAPGNEVSDFSRSIFRTSGGRYYAPAAAERPRILAARRDATLAAHVARAFARRNAQRMRAALHKSVTAGDLYIAHLFGPEAAAEFIKLVAAQPGEPAATHLPKLQRAAPAVLYARAGALTLAQFYERLTDPLSKWPRGVSAAPPARSQLRHAHLHIKPTLTEPLQRAVPASVVLSEAGRWPSSISTTRSAPPPQ